MSRAPIQMDGPHYPRRATRRAAYRWAIAVLLALAATACIVAPPAIAAATNHAG